VSTPCKRDASASWAPTETGMGWFRRPFTCELVATYEDGAKAVMTSEQSAVVLAADGITPQSRCGQLPRLLAQAARRQAASRFLHHDFMNAFFHTTQGGRVMSGHKQPPLGDARAAGKHA